MNYYNEIRNILEKSEDSFAPKAMESFENFAEICQSFCQLQSLHEYIQPASHVLTQYISPEARLTKDTNKEKTAALSLPNKLYLELFWKMYCKCYDDNEKEFINTFITSQDYERNLKKFWKSVFSGSDLMDDLTQREIQDAIENWRTLDYFSIQALNLTGLHNALKLINEGVNIAKITKAESMEKLISDNALNYFLSSAQAGNLANFYLQIAPIRKSITIGKILSGYPDYLKQSYEHNLEKLKLYTDNLVELLITYHDIMSERKELFAPYI